MNFRRGYRREGGEESDEGQKRKGRRRGGKGGNVIRNLWSSGRRRFGKFMPASLPTGSASSSSSSSIAPPPYEIASNYLPYLFVKFTRQMLARDSETSRVSCANFTSNTLLRVYTGESQVAKKFRSNYGSRCICGRFVPLKSISMHLNKFLLSWTNADVSTFFPV